jgi:DNA invertase Pin-like site-specific DNA recombinase
MLHLYAALAEKERPQISTRTKAALAAALNARGVATATGRQWEAATVFYVLKRIAAARMIAASRAAPARPAGPW